MKKLLLISILCLYSLLGFTQTYTNIYLVGTAMSCGWDQNNPIAMINQGDGTFTWTGSFKNDQFKFLLQKGSWVNCLVAQTADEMIVPGQAHRFVHEPTAGGNDYKFKISEGGIYTIVLNTTAETITLTKLDNLISTSRYDGKGKRAVNIHSCSGKTNNNENPYKLFIGRENISSNTDKWCYQGGDPWIIFSLSGMYSINGFGFRDSRFRESGALNLPGYKVYVSTSGVEDEDWHLVASATGVQDLSEKYSMFEPVLARYIKFVPEKDPADGYIRIYGVDIFGTYVCPINDEIISTGKTIVDYSGGSEGRETPANIIDGNLTNVPGNEANNPWSFSNENSWVTIDLEEQYSIVKFALTDSEEWINGCKIYVGSAADNMSLVFNGPLEQTLARKEIVLNDPVEGRYVKLEIPLENQNGLSRIREFEVYKQSETLKQAIYIDFGKNEQEAENGRITSSPDVKGNYWNNALATAQFSTLSLTNSTNATTGFELEITKAFSAGGGGLLTPDESLLSDFAVATATEDYFFVEGNTGNGSFKIKNLDKTRAYKFYVFGSKEDSNDRSGYLSFTGSTGAHGVHQMSGAGSGSGNTNQNNNSVFESEWIFPDHKGEIMFQMAVKTGGFAYVNAMKIEEYTGVEAFPVKQKFYIDLGRNDGTNGNKTTTDANGNYWNAFDEDAFEVSSGKTLTLVNSLNSQTEIVMQLASPFRANGKNSGGLTSPSAAQLGELAVQTATEDFFFIEKSTPTEPGSIEFKNMDPVSGYRFHVFGSRDNGTDRIGLFTFTGTNNSAGTHSMSGTNLGGSGINRNNSNVYVSDVIYPDATGKIIFDITRYAGDFAYVNLIKIEECANDEMLKVNSITLSGENITQAGQSVQITASMLPAGITYPPVKWEVDDTSIAWVDYNGKLYPKKNGTVTVKASVKYGETIIWGETQINITNQFGLAYATGTALQDAGDVEMHMITNSQGVITNDFELYTTLTGSGSFTIYRDKGNNEKIEYGMGGTEGTLVENGTAISTTVQGPARIAIDLTNGTYTILPITSLNVVGTATTTGTDVTQGLPLQYQGDGVWSARLQLKSGSFNFIINKAETECLKRIKGSSQVILQTQGSRYGYSMEDITTNMNGGVFDVSIDLRNYTYSLSCGEANDYKISYMGSSVCWGTGAASSKGYAYMYTNLLNQRYEQGLGMNWTTSNISVGGNTTANLLERWERDLLSDCSRYVIYGLSLGNEGIHDKGEDAYNSYRDGMLKAIKQAEDHGIVPVIANNYTRSDFNAADYNYVKQLNLLIHEWDLPSINTLGAIDDGACHWAYGYENDGAHPNTAGHEEFFFAMVPSLFDALEAGKPLPQRVSGTSYQLGKSVTTDQIEFTPENIVHPFTISFDINTTGSGTIASFDNGPVNGVLKIDNDGKLVYQSPKGGSITSTGVVNSGNWNRVTLTHYYAWGITMLYVNNDKAGELQENLSPVKFRLGAVDAPDQIEYRELYFWRAGMNAEEIAYVNDGRMLKSSLEIYAPLGGTENLNNLAQSTNTLKLSAHSTSSLDKKMYVDFGAATSLSVTTPSPDANGNHWNNVTANSTFPLIASNGSETGYQLEITKNFKINPGGEGGLSSPQATLLGDMAISTATKDYFYVENDNATFKIKNLNVNKGYKFHLFGTRLGTSDNDVRRVQYVITGTNISQGTLQTTGYGRTQNTEDVFVSDIVFPDAGGEISFSVVNSVVSSFGYINVMKIEEYIDNTGSDINAPDADAQKLQVYPNPVKKGENIFLNKNGRINIYQLGGTLVQTRDNYSSTFSTSNLQTGSYIIQLITDNDVEHVKLIVK